MPGHDIIVVGASAGGVEALSYLAERLPANLPASIFVVLHVSPHGTSILPRILARKGRLPAHHARDGEPIVPGRIYVAPPDHHLLIDRGRTVLSRGATENGHRPSVDPLFRSAARTYGPRVVGVILSGSLDDGAAGLVAVKERGGVAVVQDPGDALFSGMPSSALMAVTADRCVTLSEIPSVLVKLAQTPVADAAVGATPMAEKYEQEIEAAELDLEAMENKDRPGTPSGFACPDCGGALWELTEAELIRFRCRVGHAWSVTSLLARQSEALETALWTALRALEERSALADRLADRLDAQGNGRSARRFRAQADETRLRARVIREVLVKPEPVAEPEEDAPPPQVDTPASGAEGGY